MSAAFSVIFVSSLCASGPLSSRRQISSAKSRSATDVSSSAIPSLLFFSVSFMIRVYSEVKKERG